MRGDAVEPRALVGCFVAAVAIGALVVALVLALYVRGGSVLRWSLALCEQVLVEAAPSDWSARQEARLAAAFDAAGRALEQGDVDPHATQALSESLTECLRRASRQELRAEDLDRLIERLEGIGSASAAAPRETGEVI